MTVFERRIVYSLRRERRHIGLMQAACVTRRANADCGPALQDVATDFDARIEQSSAFRLDVRILAPRLYSFLVSVAQINNRTCGGQDIGGPCLRDAIAPIIASQGDVASIRAMIANLQQTFFALSAELRGTNLPRVMEVIRSPFPACRCVFVLRVFLCF